MMNKIVMTSQAFHHGALPLGKIVIGAGEHLGASIGRGRHVAMRKGVLAII